jgi:hypothetical protein
LGRFLDRTEVRNAFFFSLVSLVLVLPQVVKSGFNTNYNTYRDTAMNIIDRPADFIYRAIPDDQVDEIQNKRATYKYPPVFALAFRAIPYFEDTRGVIWLLALNALVFWLGVFRWFELPSPIPASTVLLLFLAVVEVGASLRFQQVNALLAGLTLLALADYRDSKFFRSGVLLSSAVAIKVMPAFFLLPLAMRWRPRFFAGTGAGFLAALLVPFLMLGIPRGWDLHAHWADVMQNDISANIYNLKGVVAAVFETPWLSTLVHYAILLVSLATMLLAFPSGGSKAVEARTWAAWLTLGLTAILLLNPRTEGPTFVMQAPAYLILIPMLIRAALQRKDSLLPAILLIIGACLTTVSPEDIVRTVRIELGYRHKNHGAQMFGTLMIWICAGWLLFRQIHESGSGRSAIRRFVLALRVLKKPKLRA